MKIYDHAYLQQTQERLNKLTAETPAQWGKMNAGQMLAHLNVSYKEALVPEANKNGFLMNFMMKKFIKPVVVGNKPYKKNSRTAPSFVITNERDFEKEKAELLKNIAHVINEGEAKFEGRMSPNFGALTAQEWNTLFDKHMQHHFEQFAI